jgi:alpha-D-ribose 1-methylphosphonate 5-triphosphate synthase subunit PhnL
MMATSSNESVVIDPVLKGDEVLSIKGLSKRFFIHELDREIHACESIDITVKQGQFIGITGKSGSGKSTILKLIYRSYLPQEGAIFYNSTSFGPVNLFELSERQMLHIRKLELGYVSQFLHVIPRTSALTIVQQALLEKGEDAELGIERAKEILTHFELPKELWDSYPATFSGGEKLRLNIAQAMVTEPRLLLLDEPTASLDIHSKTLVRDLIQTLKSKGTTMLGIFHDLEFMEGLCDQEYKMSSGRFTHDS